MSAVATPARSLTVVQLIPALQSGGAERSALEIARALVAAGHQSVVISAGGRLVSQLEAEGSRHITLDIGRKSLGTFMKVGALRRVLRELKPDIVHARSRLPAWVGWWAIKGLKPSPHFVTTVHGLNTPGRYSSILLRGERVIAVSQTLRDYMLSHYAWLEPSRVRVIPRGIDPDAFPYGHRPDDGWHKAFFAEFPALAGAPLLTLPGRGTRLKGHHDAIELVAELKRRGIDVRLLLLGVIEPGREAYVAELRELIRSRGLESQVVLTPPRADVRDIYAISSLVLQLSNKPESFGRTVIEALSLCRPVLGYAHGGVGELLAELYPAGRVPPSDQERLVERAAELLRVAPPIPMLQSYRLSDMQQATLALYDELTAA
ncbi:glycosyl transferase [Dyella jiangningensis]|uniref:glycosyltransferase n=1 Tax=Dyella jiangningensis TaxID=1379159 RepID=UPI00045653BC|nr:glycosyltransferase [Dyella jiangningensis]AHX15687.1 glycosyl transferase [Dyella jiangningensis]MDG2540157.1 glycosyltransferase [Dyella jiangningensis]